jgi:hypothetical protein
MQPQENVNVFPVLELLMFSLAKVSGMPSAIVFGVKLWG